MSAPESHISGRSHHTHTSHRTRARDDDVESNAPPESVASFSAPTVIPGDSVSQAGSRPRDSRSDAGRSHHSHHSSRHSHHSSHSRSNADWDDRSSGLLTQENLEAHNSGERSRASTPRPQEQLYVEVVEDRTVTGSYYSHNDTPRQSLHPNDGSARPHHSARSPSPRVEALSRAMEDRLSVSRSHASAHQSHTSARKSHASTHQSHASHSHASKTSKRHSSSERPESAATSKPPTVVKRRAVSRSPARSSTSHHTSHTRSHSQSNAHSQSRSRAPTSVPSHVSSHTSYRVSRTDSPPVRSSTPKVPEVYQVAVFEETPYQPSPFRDTYTVEVEAAEDQDRGRDYKIRHRHEYPVYGDI